VRHSIVSCALVFFGFVLVCDDEWPCHVMGCACWFVGLTAPSVVDRSELKLWVLNDWNLDYSLPPA
jgi:hypothetical protein